MNRINVNQKLIFCSRKNIELANAVQPIYIPNQDRTVEHAIQSIEFLHYNQIERQKWFYRVCEDGNMKKRFGIFNEFNRKLFEKHQGRKPRIITPTNKEKDLVR